METKMLGVKPRRPEVLSSTNEARAVVLGRRVVHQTCLDERERKRGR